MDGENHLLPNHTLGCRALTALPPRAKPTQIISCSNLQKLPGPPAPLLLAKGIFPSLWGKQRQIPAQHSLRLEGTCMSRREVVCPSRQFTCSRESRSCSTPLPSPGGAHKGGQAGLELRAAQRKCGCKAAGAGGLIL